MSCRLAVARVAYMQSPAMWIVDLILINDRHIKDKMKFPVEALQDRPEISS